MYSSAFSSNIGQSSHPHSPYILNQAFVPISIQSQSPTYRFRMPGTKSSSLYDNYKKSSKGNQITTTTDPKNLYPSVESLGENGETSTIDGEEESESQFDKVEVEKSDSEIEDNSIIDDSDNEENNKKVDIVEEAMKNNTKKRRVKKEYFFHPCKEFSSPISCYQVVCGCFYASPVTPSRFSSTNNSGRKRNQVIMKPLWHLINSTTQIPKEIKDDDHLSGSNYQKSDQDDKSDLMIERQLSENKLEVDTDQEKHQHEVHSKVTESDYRFNRSFRQEHNSKLHNKYQNQSSFGPKLSQISLVNPLIEDHPQISPFSYYEYDLSRCILTYQIISLFVRSQHQNYNAFYNQTKYVSSRSASPHSRSYKNNNVNNDGKSHCILDDSFFPLLPFHLPHDFHQRRLESLLEESSSENGSEGEGGRYNQLGEDSAHLTIQSDKNGKEDDLLDIESVFANESNLGNDDDDLLDEEEDVHSTFGNYAGSNYSGMYPNSSSKMNNPRFFKTKTSASLTSNQSVGNGNYFSNSQFSIPNSYSDYTSNPFFSQFFPITTKPTNQRYSSYQTQKTSSFEEPVHLPPPKVSQLMLLSLSSKLDFMICLPPHIMSYEKKKKEEKEEDGDGETLHDSPSSFISSIIPYKLLKNKSSSSSSSSWIPYEVFDSSHIIHPFYYMSVNDIKCNYIPKISKSRVLAYSTLSQYYHQLPSHPFYSSSIMASLSSRESMKNQTTKTTTCETTSSDILPSPKSSRSSFSFSQFGTDQLIDCDDPSNYPKPYFTLDGSSCFTTRSEIDKVGVKFISKDCGEEGFMDVTDHFIPSLYRNKVKEMGKFVTYDDVIPISNPPLFIQVAMTSEVYHEHMNLPTSSNLQNDELKGSRNGKETTFNQLDLEDFADNDEIPYLEELYDSDTLIEQHLVRFRLFPIGEFKIGDAFGIEVELTCPNNKSSKKSGSNYYKSRRKRKKKSSKPKDNNEEDDGENNKQETEEEERKRVQYEEDVQKEIDSNNNTNHHSYASSYIKRYQERKVKDTKLKCENNDNQQSNNTFLPPGSAQEEEVLGDILNQESFHLERVKKGNSSSNLLSLSSPNSHQERKYQEEIEKKRKEEEEKKKKKKMPEVHLSITCSFTCENSQYSPSSSSSSSPSSHSIPLKSFHKVVTVGADHCCLFIELNEYLPYLHLSQEGQVEFHVVGLVPSTGQVYTYSMRDSLQYPKPVISLDDPYYVDDGRQDCNIKVEFTNPLPIPLYNIYVSLHIPGYPASLKSELSRINERRSKKKKKKKKKNRSFVMRPSGSSFKGDKGKSPLESSYYVQSNTSASNFINSNLSIRSSNVVEYEEPYHEMILDMLRGEGELNENDELNRGYENNTKDSEDNFYNEEKPNSPHIKSSNVIHASSSNKRGGYNQDDSSMEAMCHILQDGKVNALSVSQCQGVSGVYDSTYFKKIAPFQKVAFYYHLGTKRIGSYRIVGRVISNYFRYPLIGHKRLAIVPYETIFKSHEELLHFLGRKKDFSAEKIEIIDIEDFD